MRTQILMSAFLDLDLGRQFYESQGEGLGDYFLDSLFSDIDSLSIYAGIHSQYFGYYRLLSLRFPYSIYYKIEDGRVIVYRVLDQRNHPSKLRKRLLREPFDGEGRS